MKKKNPVMFISLHGVTQNVKGILRYYLYFLDINFIFYYYLGSIISFPIIVLDIIFFLIIVLGIIFLLLLF